MHQIAPILPFFFRWTKMSSLHRLTNFEWYTANGEEGTELFFNMFSTNLTRGVLSTWSFSPAVAPASRCRGAPEKVEVKALEYNNFLLNYVFYQSENIFVSCVWVITWNHRHRRPGESDWHMSAIIREETVSKANHELARVRLVPSVYTPRILVPNNGTRKARGCQDILWWTSDDLKEFTLCPSLRSDGSRIFLPAKRCYSYQAPSDGKPILSVTRFDNTALIAIVDNGLNYTLRRLNTSQCADFPPTGDVELGKSSSLGNDRRSRMAQTIAPSQFYGDQDDYSNFWSNIEYHGLADPTNDHGCTSCTLKVAGNFGRAISFMEGVEPPNLLVPDTGQRLISYYCTNQTTRHSEQYPSWVTSATPEVDVSNCVFTLYNVKPREASIIHGGEHHLATDHPVEHPVENPIDHPATDHPIDHPSDNNSSPEGHDSGDFLNWIEEVVVPTPLQLTLAANRTVRLSDDGDLLYSTHFTRDGISSIAMLDISNGGAFDQGTLPLRAANLDWTYNSFSDDVDRVNEFLYAVGYLYDISYSYTIPSIIKYDVNPQGNPTLLTQLYVRSRSGASPTVNYMAPIPTLAGISVVSTPREVSLNRINASSIAMNAESLGYQFTSSNYMDVNIIKPILSRDGTKLVIFCQEFGQSLLGVNSTLSAYVMDIVVGTKPSPPPPPPHATPHASEPVHGSSHHKRGAPAVVGSTVGSNEVVENILKKLRSEFGDSAQVDMKDLEIQLQEMANAKEKSKVGTESRENNKKNPPNPEHSPAPEHEPPLPPTEPDVSLHNILLKVKCRFAISTAFDAPDMPISAVFLGPNHTRILISYTSAFGTDWANDTHITIYDLTHCYGANIANNETLNRTINLPIAATTALELNWNSKPFASSESRSDMQRGDAAGIRLWDVPYYIQEDESVVFWMINQSINVGVPDPSSDPIIPNPIPAVPDMSSTFVQFYYNVSEETIIITDTSNPTRCSPITSQVIPPYQLDEGSPHNSVFVWVICQYPHPPDPELVNYQILGINITAPGVIPSPSSPANSVTDSLDLKFADFNDLGTNNLPTSIDAHNYSMDQFDELDGISYESITSIGEWRAVVETNVTLTKDPWQRDELFNFFVLWPDRRVYFGDAHGLKMIAIAEQGHPVPFAEAVFNNAQQINSILAWEQFPGFGFLGDVQWVWAMAECPSGTKLTNTGYCSKCAPGTFGLGCTPCTPGYACSDFGLIVPGEVCPPGYFCPAGSSLAGIGNSPIQCPAGTYCPGGVATNITGTLNSARRCSSGFYCPAGSTTATAETCPEMSTSHEGASSIEECFCIEDHVGSAGNCQKCLYLGRCGLEPGTLESSMTYPQGYYPSVWSKNCSTAVTAFIPCTLNEAACNPNNETLTTKCYYVCGDETKPGCEIEVHKRNDHPVSGHNCRVICLDPDHDRICAVGYAGRLCSRCKIASLDGGAESYYERGHTCIPCNSSDRKTVIIWVTVACVIIGALLLLVIIGKTFIALILELLSMVLLNSIGLVPVWLLDVLLIFVLVYFINRGKRYNTLIKIQEERTEKRKLRRRAKRMAARRREMKARKSLVLPSRPKSTVMSIKIDETSSESQTETNSEAFTSDLSATNTEEQTSLAESGETFSEGQVIGEQGFMHLSDLDDDEYLDEGETGDDIDDTEEEEEDIEEELVQLDLRRTSGYYTSISQTNSRKSVREMDLIINDPIYTAHKKGDAIHKAATIHNKSATIHQFENGAATHHDASHGIIHHGDHHGDHGYGDEDHHEHEYVSEGLIKSFLFYLQTSEALGEGLFKYTELLLQLQNISPFHQIAFLDCIWPAIFSYEGKFIMYMVLIPILTVIMLLMYGAGVLKMEWAMRQKLKRLNYEIENQKQRGFFQMAWADEDEHTSLRTGDSKAEIAKLNSKKRRLRYRWTRIWLFFVSVFYFELTEGILKVFRCVEDEALGLTYMESEPWVRCSTHVEGPYSVVMPLASAGLIVYVIGVPALFFYLLYHHRKRLHDPKVMSWLGMLYEEYQPNLWWFEMTMIARRVCIAMIISMIPSDSIGNNFIPVLVMATLLTAMAINIWFRAFVSDAENTVDLMAMCVMLITYIAGVVQRLHQLEQKMKEFTSPALMHHEHEEHEELSWKSLPPLEIFLFVLNTLMFFGYLGMLLRPRIGSVYRWAKRRWQERKQSKIDDMNALLAEEHQPANTIQTDDESSDIEHGSRRRTSTSLHGGF